MLDDDRDEVRERMRLKSSRLVRGSGSDAATRLRKC